MACFSATVAEAIATTAIKKKMGDVSSSKNPFIKRLGWLNNMLWGGSALLLFEHVWHGEIVPWAPFLTRAANPADAIAMIQEIATTGIGMAAVVTTAWAAMAAVAASVERKAVEVKD